MFFSRTSRSQRSSRADCRTTKPRVEALEARDLTAVDLTWPAMDNFIPKSSVNSLEDKHFVLAGDFLGRDGRADIVYLHKESGANRIVKNLGNGQYENLDNRIPTGAFNKSYDNVFMLAGDFNGDGRSDLMSIHKRTGENRILWNLADGVFKEENNLLNPGEINGLEDSHFVVAGDLDADGDADLAYIHKAHGGNRVLQNDGKAKRWVRRDYALPAGAINGMHENHVVVAGNFDGDLNGNGHGRADIVFIHKGHGGNRTLINRGDWRFEVRDNWLPGGSVNGLGNKNYVVAGDFDKDARKDAELLFINKSSGENRLLGTVVTGVWFGANRSACNWNDGIVTLTGGSSRDEIVITDTAYGTHFRVNDGWCILPKSYTKQIVVKAGDGDDWVQNNSAIPSLIYGGRGNDVLDGGAESDALFGEQGDDELYGRSGADALDGGTGNDKLFGGNHVDFLFGGDGNDRLDGGEDNDLIIDNVGANICYIGPEVDLVSAPLATNTASRSFIFILMFFPRPTDSGPAEPGTVIYGGNGSPEARARTEALVYEKYRPLLESLENRILIRSYEGPLGFLRQLEDARGQMEEIAIQPNLSVGSP